MTCPSCGARVPDGARFCPECGQRLVVAPEERRLVTVVMADLVGFTNYSEAADPEQVKRLVDQCFERLVKDFSTFGGRLDKIVGDEIVALFGTPVAHEDDAERAVRAALRMHETLALVAEEIGVPVQMRVGVNTGEVLVGAMRAGGESTVMGDVVNTAQRLADRRRSRRGDRRLGDLRRDAVTCVEYEALGLLTVRGRDEPIEAYRGDVCSPHRVAAGPADARRSSAATTRSTRCATCSRWRAARNRAQLVLLYGDAGVGKSRLANEISRSRGGGARRARVLIGHCVPYGDTNVFGPVAEVLREACGIEGMGGTTDARSLVVAAVNATLGFDNAVPSVLPKTSTARRMRVNGSSKASCT